MQPNNLKFFKMTILNISAFSIFILINTTLISQNLFDLTRDNSYQNGENFGRSDFEKTKQ